MSSTTHQVRLEIFCGPLDLLLHLIRKNDLNIFDIPIHQITSEYLRYLALMECCDLNATSEFLVMAAILIQTKSRMLLPGQKADLEEEMVEDPRTELVRLLLEYKEYKEAANFLKEKFLGQEKVYTRPPRSEPGLIEVSLFNLLSAYAKLIEKRQDVVSEISHDETSITQRMQELLACFEAQDALCFEHLFFRDRTKGELIVTLLALLELVRLRRLRVEQVYPFSEIRIYRD